MQTSAVDVETTISVGEILVLDFMVPRGITLRTLVASTGITEEVLIEVIQGRRNVNREISEKLGAEFGESPDFWERLANTVSWTERMRLRTKCNKPLAMGDGEIKERR